MTTITTGLSFDFFTSKNTQENSGRAGGYCLRYGLRMGRRVLARTLHGRAPQYAAGQHSISWRDHARGFVSGRRILIA